MKQILIFLGGLCVAAFCVWLAHRAKPPAFTEWEFGGRTNLFDLGFSQGGFVDWFYRYQDGKKLMRREWYDDDGRLTHEEGPAFWLPAINVGVIHDGGDGPSDEDKKAKGVA
jgi:hypothetical protein